MFRRVLKDDYLRDLLTQERNLSLLFGKSGGGGRGCQDLYRLVKIGFRVRLGWFGFGNVVMG